MCVLGEGYVCARVLFLPPPPSSPIVRLHQILEPGERWACLVKKEWTTQEKRDLQAAGQFNVRGFKGQYELLIERNGVPVELRQLTLGDSDLDYKFTVTSNTGT